MKKSQDTWKNTYDRLITIIHKQLSKKVTKSFEIRTWNNQSFLFGNGEPVFRVNINDSKGLSAISQLDELKICEAYMDGNLDFTGDMFEIIQLRNELTDIHPLHYLLCRIVPLFISQVHTNRDAIASHYDFDSDFYLKFLDKSRCYSQAVFESDGEPLEDAQNRKLQFIIESCRLKPGDQVLDVGGGWGAFTEFAGLRDIKVTSLTISDESEKFISDLICKLNLPCRVLNRDFLNFNQPNSFDAVVILGVMEHLPDYEAVIRQIKKNLRPGGLVYIDASAYRQKYVKPSFISKHIFPGGHSFLCLHDFLTVAEKKGLEILQVINDRHRYYLTCKAWAENLESAREEIISRWGETLYRRFHIYLWGSAYALFSRSLCAYRVILENR